ncbi:MAG: hypothetical protein MJE68_02330 [Proteobacteria bacterium]|nr:hypothetical protein [Pseudomonadota bacterium]
MQWFGQGLGRGRVARQRLKGGGCLNKKVKKVLAVGLVFLFACAIVGLL